MYIYIHMYICIYTYINTYMYIGLTRVYPRVPLLVSSGSPAINPTIDQNRPSGYNNPCLLRLLAEFTRKEGSTGRKKNSPKFDNEVSFHGNLQSATSSPRSPRAANTRWLFVQLGYTAQFDMWSLLNALCVLTIDLLPILGLPLAFTQYCHYQDCMVPDTQEGGRAGNIHCAISLVGKIQGGEIKKAIIELANAQSQNKQTNLL